MEENEHECNNSPPIQQDRAEPCGEKRFLAGPTRRTGYALLSIAIGVVVVSYVGVSRTQLMEVPYQGRFPLAAISDVLHLCDHLLVAVLALLAPAWVIILRGARAELEGFGDDAAAAFLGRVRERLHIPRRNLSS